MKPILIASLSTLTLCAIASTAKADPSPVGLNSTGSSYPIQEAIKQTTPVDLVNLARHGYLRDQGIPSGGKLDWEYQAGDITAEKLVKAGIQAHRVPSLALNDRAYLNAVEAELRDLTEPNFVNGN